MNKVISLIKDHELPEIIRQIVGNAPRNRKVAAFMAAVVALCAMCPRVRLKYFFDSRLSALLLQVLIEGAQSSGKSFAADIEGLIMNNTLKARDKAMRRLEQEYRDKRKRRKANEKLESEPETTIRVVPPTISKTVLTKRADMYERVLGDTLTFWMFAEELAQVTDAGKNGYSNLRTIMRTAYDLGSQFGIDFASDNSYSAIVDINICSMFCATPAAIDGRLYINRKHICDTVEHPTRHLPAGKYIISSLDRSEVCRFRHGDGALSLKQQEIIVGKYLLPGVVTASQPTYDRLYERLKKAVQRGSPIHLTIRG